MARKILNFPASDWLNFIHFSGYKYKIGLVSRLRKREDQDLMLQSGYSFNSNSLNQLSSKIYTAQLHCLMFIRLFKVIT